MAMDRGILRPLMYQAIKSGSSFNAFYRSARSHGLQQRRADMLSDWQSVREEVANRRVNTGIDRSAIPEATEISGINFLHKGSYYYRVRVNYKEPTPEGKRYQIVTTIFDTPQTIDAILRETSLKFEAGEYESLSNIKGFSFLEALKAPLY